MRRLEPSTIILLTTSFSTPYQAATRNRGAARVAQRQKPLRRRCSLGGAGTHQHDAVLAAQTHGGAAQRGSVAQPRVSRVRNCSAPPARRAAAAMPRSAPAVVHRLGGVLDLKHLAIRAVGGRRQIVAAHHSVAVTHSATRNKAGMLRRSGVRVERRATRAVAQRRAGRARRTEHARLRQCAAVCGGERRRTRCRWTTWHVLRPRRAQEGPRRGVAVPDAKKRRPRVAARLSSPCRSLSSAHAGTGTRASLPAASPRAAASAAPLRSHGILCCGRRVCRGAAAAAQGEEGRVFGGGAVRLPRGHNAAGASAARFACLRVAAAAPSLTCVALRIRHAQTLVDIGANLGACTARARAFPAPKPGARRSRASGKRTRRRRV